MSTPNCIYTPPEEHKIQPYLMRLISIVNQLNDTHNKTVALERLQLLMDNLDSVINAVK